MKKIMIFCFCLIALVSCMGTETPRIECGEKPFVVKKITLRNDGNCLYEALYFNAPIGEFFSTRPSFIAPKGMYSIGDTVRLCH